MKSAVRSTWLESAILAFAAKTVVANTRRRVKMIHQYERALRPRFRFSVYTGDIGHPRACFVRRAASTRGCVLCRQHADKSAYVRVPNIAIAIDGDAERPGIVARKRKDRNVAVA